MIAELPQGFRDAVAAQVETTYLPKDPGRMLEQWLSLVEGCETGYDDIPGEFMFDLQIRDLIEECLQSPDISALAGFDIFQQAVNAIDARYKAILLPAGLPTYRAGLHFWLMRWPDRGTEAYINGLPAEVGIWSTRSSAEQTGRW